jgi:hypothetical protein
VALAGHHRVHVRQEPRLHAQVRLSPPVTSMLLQTSLTHSVCVAASREKLRRLHAMLPSARLVLLLRDPVSKCSDSPNSAPTAHRLAL